MNAALRRRPEKKCRNMGECRCQAVPQAVELGGDFGWTDGANVNYTQFMTAVAFKEGTLYLSFPPAGLVRMICVVDIPLAHSNAASLLLWASSPYSVGILMTIKFSVASIPMLHPFDLIFVEVMVNVVFASVGFNNTDIQHLSVLQVYSQDNYDACNRHKNTAGVTRSGLPSMDNGPTYCLVGHKLEFALWNSDGTADPPDTGADPPSLGAPPGSDGNSLRAPPDPPLSLAGGLTPNPVDTSQAKLAIAMVVSSARYLAT